MSDIEERLREKSTELLGVAWSRSDGGHGQCLDAVLAIEAANEIERLRALAKANNQLARINGDHRDEWRAKAVTLAEALEPFAEAQWTGLRSAEPGTPLDERDVFEVDGLKIGDFNRARAALARDSGRLPEGRDGTAPCEASQSGAEGNRPPSTGDHP
jgi:hypothetical protein